MRKPSQETLSSLKWIGDNPWVRGIMGVVVGALLTGIIFSVVCGKRQRQMYADRQDIAIDIADTYLKKNMTEDALAIYHEVLTEVSEQREPLLYGRLKHNEGVC